MRLCACVVTVVALAACGGGQRSGGSGQPSTSAVTIRNFAYLPAHATVGTRLTFDNRDTVEHTATADDGTTFDTGSLQVGASKTITLTKRGTFSYHCDFHPFMHGTIVVR